MKVIRSKNVSSHSPAGGKARGSHLHCAKTYFIHRPDVPTAMVQTGSTRFGKGDHVMVAAVDAMHKGDAISGAIREPEPQYFLIERDRFADIHGKHKNVREPARLNSRRSTAIWSAALAGGNRRILERRFPVR